MLGGVKDFEMMNEISYKYQHYSNYLAKCESGYIKGTNEKQDALAFINRVYQAYMKLKDFERELIQKEFFYKDDVSWWKGKYDGAQFKLVYNSSIRRFINLYLKL